MKLTARQENLLKRTSIGYMPLETFLQNPLVVERAQGLYYWDVEGKRYFDGIGGIFVAVLGHGHARLLDAMRQQMFQQFGGAGGQDLDLKSLLPDDMFRDNAERRVKLGLVLAELVGKLELKTDAAKVREAIEEMASTYQDPDEVINYYYSNQDQLSAIESRVLEDQMVEKLLESANIVEKQCSYQEAIGQAQAEG